MLAIPSIVDVSFPLGTLPVGGYRCPACGEEWIPAEEVARAQALGHKLGMFGVESVSRRKIRQTGTSVSVTLDPALLREIAPDASPGDDLLVGRQGDRIVIRRPPP